MIERNKRILSRVRLKLDDVAATKFQNDELYDAANIVQQDLMNDTFCNERAFDLPLICGMESYNLESQKVQLIKDIYPSWNGKIEMVANSDWKKYRGMPGQLPVCATVFSQKLFVAPVPKTDTEMLTIWSYQLDVINPMDNDTPPETPEAIDDVLVMGICAEFNVNLLPFYENKKSKLLSLLNKKHSMGVQVNQTW